MAYTVPAFDSLTFNHTPNYTPPAGDALDLTNQYFFTVSEAVWVVLAAGGTASETLEDTTLVDPTSTDASYATKLVEEAVSLDPTNPTAVSADNTNAEQLYLIDAPSQTISFIKDLTDLLSLVAEADKGIDATAEDGVALSAADVSVVYQIIQLVNDLASGSDTITANISVSSIADAVVAMVTAQALTAFGSASEDTLSIAEAYTLHSPKSIAETFAVAATVLQQNLMTAQSNDAVSLSVTTTLGAQFSLEDIVGLTEYLTSLCSLIGEATSTVSLEAEATPSIYIYAAATDVTALTAESSVEAVITALATDTVRFFGLVPPTEEGNTLVLNTENTAVSEYSNFAFNSYAYLQGQLLACKDDGLYLLGGDTDNGTEIEAILRTGLMDFGTSNKKILTDAYIGYTTSGRLLLKTLSTEGGTKQERWYELTAVTADSPTANRVKTAHGVKARYWQFEIRNLDGNDFELEKIEVLPVITGRRL